MEDPTLRRILRESPDLPDELRDFALRLSNGACEFSKSWVEAKRALRREGELPVGEIRWLEAVESYAGQELYGAVLVSEEGEGKGWVVVDPDAERVVCWQRYGWGSWLDSSW